MKPEYKVLEAALTEAARPNTRSGCCAFPGRERNLARRREPAGPRHGAAQRRAGPLGADSPDGIGGRVRGAWERRARLVVAAAPCSPRIKWRPITVHRSARVYTAQPRPDPQPSQSSAFLFGAPRSPPASWLPWQKRTVSASELPDPRPQPRLCGRLAPVGWHALRCLRGT
jgi:hypothetical protein